jgi:GntR family transcriptional regulator, transcriptional repressor for pyruvate dehydrogenase complex
MRKNLGGESLVSRAIQSVRDHIRTNDLKVGDPLPGEAHFADVVGVSRAVIREAFGALAALKLIDVANGRRARVGAMDGSVMGASLEHAVTTEQVTLRDVWDVRRTVELRTAELAATERTDAEAAEIVAHAEAMVAADGDMEEIARHDLALHAAIASATHNALFIQVVQSFAPLLKATVPAAWKTRDTVASRSAMLRHHLALAQAIEQRDAAQARSLMSQHFDASIIEKATAEKHPVATA